MGNTAVSLLSCFVYNSFMSTAVRAALEGWELQLDSKNGHGAAQGSYCLSIYFTINCFLLCKEYSEKYINPKIKRQEREHPPTRYLFPFLLASSCC